MSALRDWFNRNANVIMGIGGIVAIAATFAGWYGDWFGGAPETPNPPGVSVSVGGDNSGNVAASVEGPAVSTGDNSTVIIGLTIEQHEERLAKRDAEIRAELDGASAEDRQVLEGQLAEISAKMADLEADYEARVRELAELRNQLAAFRGTVPEDRLEAAQQALYEGDTTLADGIFAEVSKAADLALAQKAAAEYGRGEIAESEVRWADAARHYGEAARLTPNYDYLRMAYRNPWTGRAVCMAQPVPTGRRAPLRGRRPVGSLNNLAKAEFDHPRGCSGTPGGTRKPSRSYREAMEHAGRRSGRTIRTMRPASTISRCWNTGRYEEAEPLYREAMEIAQRRRSGRTIRTMRSEPQQSRGTAPGHRAVRGGRAALREAMEIGAGRRSGRTIRTMRRASTISRGCSGHRAVRGGRAALPGGHGDHRRKALGTDHPDYATSLNNLAELLRATGRYEEAEPLFREAMETTGKALGTDHPDYATSLNNLAGLLRDTGRYEEAEPLFREAMETGPRRSGRDHPNCATSLNNLDAAPGQR